jgi:hypothetical protein
LNSLALLCAANKFFEVVLVAFSDKFAGSINFLIINLKQNYKLLAKLYLANKALFSPNVA